MAKKLSPLDDLIIEEIRRREEQEREKERPRIYDEEMPIIEEERRENSPEEPKENRGVWEWKIWGKGRNN
ncbi:MAG: hypothetical protein WC526_01150 [Patescibacteria group bacterium]